MSPGSAATLEQKRWGGAFAAAAGLHLLGALAVLIIVRPLVPAEPEPVMIVELPSLPPPAAAAPMEQASEPAPPQIAEPVRQPTPVIEAPRINVPVPKDAVTIPPKPVQPAMPVAASPAPATAPAASPAPAAPTRTLAPAAEASVGDDPRARKQEADYFAILSAHLRRNKTYPAEAKKARQQGVVTIRFTVDREGRVSGESIKRSSGHDILDSATLQLLRRVSPLPPMPASMKKGSVTVSLPIDYSLTTK